ncbi:MAG TPA: class I SAM-dependent methyltransferase [Arsenicitalea sp.]|jgi:SAM-dependent methyltransferase|nr:class I SAM-dependent methyltransferase [Arsenicitalea sp.]
MQDPIADAPNLTKYGNARGYDAYMGHWSTALAPLLLQFADVAQSRSILDIGCGTGSLLMAAAAQNASARLVGIDPAAALLRRARQRPELAGVSLIEGSAETLRFADAEFDACLSLLVLQEFSDQPRVMSEMRRVTRPGGAVAACQWDFARMPVIDALVAAINATAPGLGAPLSGSSPHVITNEAELAALWTGAGFRDVVADRLPVTREFENFDALWQPLLTGSTPSTLTLAAMPRAQQVSVRARMQARFGIENPDAEFSLTAEALVVRGRA